LHKCFIFREGGKSITHPKKLSDNLISGQKDGGKKRLRPLNRKKRNLALTGSNCQTAFYELGMLRAMPADTICPLSYVFTRQKNPCFIRSWDMYRDQIWLNYILKNLSTSTSIPSLLRGVWISFPGA